MVTVMIIKPRSERETEEEEENLVKRRRDQFHGV
jgi:hypothetical protein